MQKGSFSHLFSVFQRETKNPFLLFWEFCSLGFLIRVLLEIVLVGGFLQWEKLNFGKKGLWEYPKFVNLGIMMGNFVDIGCFYFWIAFLGV